MTDKAILDRFIVEKNARHSQILAGLSPSEDTLRDGLAWAQGEMSIGDAIARMHIRVTSITRADAPPGEVKKSVDR